MTHFLLIWILSCMALTVQAQTNKRDSLKSIRSIKDAYDNVKVTDEHFPLAGNDTVIKILENIQDKTIRLEGVKTILENRLDTTDMRETLPKYMSMIDMLIANSRENTGKLNMRYLMGLEVLVKTMLENTNSFNQQLRDNLKQLNQVEGSLVSLGPDSSMLLGGKDSIAMGRFKDKVSSLESSARELTIRYEEQKLVIAKYQTTVSELQIKLLELQNMILAEKKNVRSSIWKKEINYLWESPSYPSEDWREKVSTSNLLNGKILTNYFQKSIGQTIKVLIAVLAIFILAFYFLRRKWGNTQNGAVLQKRVRNFHRYPFLSAIVLVLPLSYLIYSDISVIFMASITLIYILSSLPLAFLHFGHKTRVALIAGLPALFYFSYSRLLWETIFEFRWALLFFALCSAVLGAFLWKHADEEWNDGKKNTVLKYLSGFLFVFSIIGVVAITLGRFNLAKVSATTAIVSFYRGIGLYFFVQVTLEAIYLLLEGSKASHEQAASVMEYQEFHNKVRYILSILAFLIWTYFTLFYLNWLDPLIKTASDFLQKSRRVGDMEFTFNAIALFIGIILLSYFLANTIAYFTSLREQRSAISRKNRIGSSVLLIRLGIMIVGFLLAIAATKIPLDRITIVLGALSVGIGFGLQNIVDNLASGIILALERPIQIGDQVEVDNKAGTVKEIGIRSSMIRSSDGSDIVFPNSQLISQGLVNWTLKDNFKKVEITVGVANSSDPIRAKKILDQIMEHKEVMKQPAPKVTFHDFDKFSVNLRINFWVNHPSEASKWRSEIICEIVERFAENGIRMPEKED